MDKYHVYIYEVTGIIEIETLASNEIKAREMALDYVLKHKPKFGEPDCNLIAMEHRIEEKEE